jgi:hypothetical protein
LKRQSFSPETAPWRNSGDALLVLEEDELGEARGAQAEPVR